jgi:hypothetical protein
LTTGTTNDIGYKDYKQFAEDRIADVTSKPAISAKPNVSVKKVDNELFTFV